MPVKSKTALGRILTRLPVLTRSKQLLVLISSSHYDGCVEPEPLLRP